MENLKKYTLLIVDDDDDLRETIVFDYQRQGFSVLSASGGKDAIEIVKKNKVDLVISDMRMPEGDGITLLEQIRIHNSKSPAVILITGFSDVTEEECLAKGAQFVFQKPFDRKLLMATVIKTLDINSL